MAISNGRTRAAHIILTLQPLENCILKMEMFADLKVTVMLYLHCKKSDFWFVKSTGAKLKVRSEVYFLV